jgi:hypothetical protein
MGLHVPQKKQKFEQNLILFNERMGNFAKNNN